MPRTHSVTSSGDNKYLEICQSFYLCHVLGSSHSTGAMSWDLAGSHLFILHVQESKLRKMAFADQLVKAQMAVMSRGGLTCCACGGAQLRPIAIHSIPPSERS